MQKASDHSNRVTVIIVVIASLTIGLGLYGFITGIRDFQASLTTQKQERRTKLAALMPPAPANFALVKEGYDPKANCFDKCGFEYRTYTFPSVDTVCADLLSTIQNDRHNPVVESINRKVISNDECNSLVQASRQKTPAPSVLLYVAAPMEHVVNGKPVTTNTRFASLWIDLHSQQVSYHVSQEYVGYRFPAH